MRVKAAGVDTWSLCWYVEPGGAAYRAMEALATEPAPRGKLIPEAIAGHRVGWFPGHRLLFAEGHPLEGGLAAAGELLRAADAVAEGLRDVGVEPPSRRAIGRRDARPGPLGDGFGGVRRLDTTIDLAFDDPVEGQAVLAGVAAMSLPRSKTQVLREVGGRRIETVAFRSQSGAQVLGRWYDKGVETGDAARGTWVRPEDQRRFKAGHRLPLEAVAARGYLRENFVRRFEPLWRAGKGIKVGGAIDLARRVMELRDEGELTSLQARRIAGQLLLEAAGDESAPVRTQRRYRAEARRHGLVLADDALQEVEIDLGEVLREALEADVWDRSS